jgi:hypothetical protein
MQSVSESVKCENTWLLANVQWKYKTIKGLYSPQITSWSQQGMLVLRQCKVPRALLSNMKTFAPQTKKWTRLLQCNPNCPMFAVRLSITMSLYRWPISFPSTCVLCTPHALQQGRLHHAGINSWSVNYLKLQKWPVKMQTLRTRPVCDAGTLNDI